MCGLCVYVWCYVRVDLFMTWWCRIYMTDSTTPPRDDPPHAKQTLFMNGGNSKYLRTGHLSTISQVGND